MSTHTFIVSDESRNSQGFVIRTDGIDTTEFERNPVMYYMHDRFSGVVGRWENIRKEGGKLLMDGVFDDSTELGRQVKSQVENGFLRCASIGVDQMQEQDVDGVKTVVVCRLVEVSIVDIPANRNAVKLSERAGICTFAAILHDGGRQDLRAAISALLGLPEGVSDADILRAVEMLVAGQKSAENKMQQALAAELIDEDEAEAYLSMANESPALFESIIEKKGRKAITEAHAAIMAAVRTGKIDACHKDLFERVAATCGAKAVCRILDIMRTRVSVAELIRENERKNGTAAVRAGWSLDDYRRHAPDELAENPTLYAELLEREGRRPPLTRETLDYYRRHHAEYLRKHPEEYKKALNDTGKTN